MFDLTNYEYDIFISYSWDAPCGPWVAKHFAPCLEEWLTAEFGRKPRIFWDRTQLNYGEKLSGTIQRALLGSPCLVPVWSNMYFKSNWCIAEWRTFRLRESRKNLTQSGVICPVLFHGDPGKYPTEARVDPALYCDMRNWNYFDEAKDMQDYSLFRKEVRKLAAQLKERVNEAPQFVATWPICTGDQVAELRKQDPGGKEDISGYYLVDQIKMPKVSFAPPAGAVVPSEARIVVSGGGA